MRKTSPASVHRSPLRAPAGISIFGFWCCLIALVAVVGLAVRCDTRGGCGGRGFYHPPRCSFALSSVSALFSTRGMRAFIVIRLAGVALAQFDSSMEGQPGIVWFVEGQPHVLCGLQSGYPCVGATFSDSVTATCLPEACIEATFSNFATATCYAPEACRDATFSDSATATCSTPQACLGATFSNFATATCSAPYACDFATFSDSATATCSQVDACLGATFDDAWQGCCIGIGCPSDLPCPPQPPPPSPPPLLPPAAPSGANACGSGTSLNGATGQCEASLGEGTAVEGGKVVIACSGNRRLDEYEGAQGPEEAQQGAPEPAVEAIWFLANNPAYLAKLRNLKTDEEATDSTTDLMKQLLSLFGRPALAQDERASA